MIVSLAENVCQQIREIDTLQRNKLVAADIQNTYEALKSLKEQVIRLHTLLQLIQTRLIDSELRLIQTGLEDCSARLLRSATQFEDQQRQGQELQSIQERIEEQYSILQQAWKRYARAVVSKPIELHALVYYLPEVVAQQAHYGTLRQKLEDYKEKAPVSARQLQEFDQCLEQFTSLLGGIEGLSEAVKTFLLRTVSGKATLADVTDEVLQWCRLGDHAQAFSIQFAR